MANNIDTVREPTRPTFTYGLFREDLAQLRVLGAQVDKHSLRDFSKDYGNILSLLNTIIDLWVVQTLLQFYDPPLRCFTFQDYQLAPTL